MLLYHWWGYLQGPGCTSKCGNLLKSNQKITKKMLSTNVFIFHNLFQAFACRQLSVFGYGPWPLNTYSLFNNMATTASIHIFYMFFCLWQRVPTVSTGESMKILPTSSVDEEWVFVFKIFWVYSIFRPWTLSTATSI